MSPQSSSRSGVAVDKPKTNIYTVMLIIALIALMMACLLLWLEVSSYGSFPWWKTPRI
ncbi:MAG: hypothetical protein AAGF97_00810 [Planctomycetota bacterium]